jgi:hypothetical protein
MFFVQTISVPPAPTQRSPFRWFPPQDRHPERSASPIYRMIQRLCAESKDLGGAHFTHAVRSFSTTEAGQQDRLRWALDGPVAGPPGADLVVEKLRAAWVK